MLKLIWNKFPAFLKNRYAFTVLLFVMWMLFFDQHDFMTQIKLKQELYQLQDDRTYYLSEISKAKADLEELMTDDRQLEKFAREKYYMKKDNEEIFVIVKEE